MAKGWNFLGSDLTELDQSHRRYIQIKGQMEKQVNPLSPKINMQILLTVLHIFLVALAGRICLNIKKFIFGDHFLNSHDLYML